MSNLEKVAYEKLIEELKNKYPFFKRYNNDFFYNEKKNDELIKKYFDIYKTNDKDEYGDKEIKKYTNLLVEEMDKSFYILEKNDTISSLCNTFLKSYKYNTNNYYDYINQNYMNSDPFQKNMENYIQRKSNKSISQSSKNIQKNLYTIENQKGKNTEAIQERLKKRNMEVEIKNKIEHKNTCKIKKIKKNNDTETIYSKDIHNIKNNIEKYSEEKNEILYFIQHKIKNNIDIGFCDISYIPFIKTCFYINYGCVNVNIFKKKIHTVFMIDNYIKQNNNKNTPKYKRIITFGSLGKQLFLKNIKPYSIVKGWIYKYDVTCKCFFIKIFSIQNENNIDDKYTSNISQNYVKNYRKKKDSNNDTYKFDEINNNNLFIDNSQIEHLMESEFKNEKREIVACLPFNFINNFEFVNNLDIKGLNLDQNFKHFLGMSICAHIYNDQKYIESNFNHILYKYDFDFFITFNYNNYMHSDKIGFIVKEVPFDILKNQNVISNNSKGCTKFLLSIFNFLLFSSKQFLNAENIIYKEKYFLLNLSHIPSLIHFNFRNNLFKIDIGYTITQKQNLFWSNTTFIEAFEIYKNNSEYYKFLKNYFSLDYNQTNFTCIYEYRKNKFTTETNKHLGNKTNILKEYIHDHHIDISNKYNDNSNIPHIHKKKNINNEHIDGDNNNQNNVANLSTPPNVEQSIISKIKFLNSNLYKTKWIYDFFECIKLSINLNNNNILANFLLSLVLFELSCYSESFLFLFRIFKIKKIFIDSYKLKNIICTIFINQLNNPIDKDVLWDNIINFKQYDLFNMKEDSSEKYCKNVFKRNKNIINILNNIKLK
ncbi:conserved Plasmodium protein, unknown function [Plasmodium berghei]|uniref:Uncharacterized protein n=2 Tax=Plasmodium berghei TaxID=5821 RepID=A0A509AHB2_PLABA|nr:conserved Plasmodium protein, unknown function [Plasmodium berghei ANKA]CXH89402.1 conserved Plasmodium protein, unknown function [Plasmodium berghei]SCL90325.1 conserved Plasmodium protein, unknown function [Plasmodium berghei]SCM15269.1 conserved Plasmodium protein, unknown function [Plasmodium berghei]SCM17064.1 conserved Plasmodium protein, unknown function [Plasmodium berghei]SCN21960.1 conserved Plasmodium protein, unknown function [Plasmodium berghei]|eukprot:XP_034419844.1 conserved Plasmodium protein, unknown function [Plasmodium berghei ANKA]